jgi:hypothetical protein
MIRRSQYKYSDKGRKKLQALLLLPLVLLLILELGVKPAPEHDNFARSHGGATPCKGMRLMLTDTTTNLLEHYWYWYTQTETETICWYWYWYC